MTPHLTNIKFFSPPPHFSVALTVSDTHDILALSSYFHLVMKNFKSRLHNVSRKVFFAEALGCSPENLHRVLAKMYSEEKKSAQDIATILFEKTNLPISPKSIQRWLKPFDILRTSPESFSLAHQQGKITYHWKGEKMQTRFKRIGGSSAGAKIRYAILSRDHFRCVLCGASAESSTLEIVHIVPLCREGKNTEDNLRTLCSACNIGKRLAEKEN